MENTVRSDIPNITLGTVVSDFMKLYGPYAFGVISLLLIWFTIIGPELAQNRVDNSASQKLSTELAQVSQTLKDISGQQYATAEALKSTAQILSEAIRELRAK